MDIEAEQPNKEEHMSRALKRSLLVLNCVLLFVGDICGPLILRLYFLKGGNLTWLSAWSETGGWPIIIFPLLISYIYRRRNSGTESTKLFFITPRLFVACAILGLLTGLDDFLYAFGLLYLPVSTSALLISTQLAFTAFFAFLVVKQKFTPFSINSVALLTIGAVILGLHTSSDRPANVTKGQYFMGFFMTLGAAALYGLVLPLIELTYAKAKLRITYTLVMEMQLVMAFFATALCTVGMLIKNDFQEIAMEAKNFELGEVRYYVVIVWSAILWQFFFLGAVGVIFCASSLLTGIIIAVLIPVTEVLAVIFYHEKFSSEKGLSLVLCLWGFVSYFYGEIRANREKKLVAKQRQIES